MAEFKTVSLADQVYEKLESDIIMGVYPCGEVLTELKLVEQLGVSRTPIREAMRRLEQERLIRDSGKGSVVLGITRNDLEDIMNIRQRIEGLASYYATINGKAAEVEELRKIIELQEFYFDKKDVEQMRRMDDRFHETIYDLSGRVVIHDTLQPLHRKALRYRKKSMEDESRLPLSVAEHKAIYQAIAAGDAELAEKLTQEHIANAKESMLRSFDK